MAKVTPAQILYPAFDSAGVETVNPERVDFHSVIAEVHSIAAEITKYPVQSGFHVSNHSIRQNRNITIKGAITNTSLAYNGTEQNFGTAVAEGSGFKGKYRNYGSKATNTVFQMLEELIINGTQCKVITNLGIYLPVVFKGFETTQKEGMVDSIEFTISGEEVIIVDASTLGGSVPLAFTELTGSAFDAELLRLANESIPVDGCSKLSTASIAVGQDFHVDEIDNSGQAVTTKYVFIGRDPTTGEAKYEVLVDETTTKQVGSSNTTVSRVDPCEEESVASSISNKAMQTLDCFVDEATDIITERVIEEIDTAIGKVESKLRGLFYDTVGFTDGTTSALASAGIGCLARSITGSDSPGKYQPGESLPTGAQIFEGASDLISGKPEVVTVTQIICDCTSSSAEDIDASLLPDYSNYA